MGNGESTSRRVSMQRSDEGTIQISENVMNRLNRLKSPENDNSVSLDAGESVIHEEDLKNMLEKAYHNGQHTAISRLQAEQEKLLVEDGANTDDEKMQNQQLRQMVAYWKSEFEKQNEEIEQNAGSKNQHQSLNVEQEKRHQQQCQKFEAMINKLEQEKIEIEGDKNELEQQLLTKVGENVLSDEQRKLLEEKNKAKEEALQGEFNVGVQSIESQITPLQRSPICTDIQTKVLECYRQNKKQPLKCAIEVEEFVQCVQAARVKLMQKKLYDPN